MAHGDDSVESEQAIHVQCNYIKSHFFRVMFAEGAYGGITPRGYIAAAIYNDRKPIPKRTEATFTQGRPIVNENPVDSLEGFVREVELVFDLSSAKSYAKWLGEKPLNWSACWWKKNAMQTPGSLSCANWNPAKDYHQMTPPSWRNTVGGGLSL